MANKHIGTKFDDFLQEEGLLAETEALALKNIFSWEISKAIKEQGLTKSEIAKKIGTSRTAFDRFLDPKNISVTLKSLEKTAIALGKRISIEIRDAAS